MYKNTPNPKNTAGKLTALITLIIGAALFGLSYTNMIKPAWLSQIFGLILVAVAIYIASVYLLRRYTFIIEASDTDTSVADFIITEQKNNRDITVCRIGVDEIISARVVTPQNKKTVAEERKSMKRYSYDTQFAPNRQIEIVAQYEDEKLSIIVTYDEKLLNILNSHIKNRV